jgi:hypothetical protein
VIDPALARNLGRAIRRSIVDHEPLDVVETLDVAREVGERPREYGLLVQAWDLNDQLHRTLCRNVGA